MSGYAGPKGRLQICACGKAGGRRSIVLAVIASINHGSLKEQVPLSHNGIMPRQHRRLQGSRDGGCDNISVSYACPPLSYVSLRSLRLRATYKNDLFSSLCASRTYLHSLTLAYISSWSREQVHSLRILRKQSLQLPARRCISITELWPLWPSRSRRLETAT